LSLLAIYWLRDRLDKRTSFYVLAILGLPLALFCARLPNLVIYRYYLLPAVALLLLLSDVFAEAWKTGGASRMIAGIVAAALLAGNAMELAKFYEYGRGSFQEPLRVIASSGTPTVASNLEGVAATTLDFYATRLNTPVTTVSSADLCKTGA